MNIVWQNNPKVQLERYLTVHNNVFNGFYIEKKFFISGKLHEKNHRVVYYPLPQSFISKGLSQNKLDNPIDLINTKNFIDNIQELLPMPSKMQYENQISSLLSRRTELSESLRLLFQNYIGNKLITLTIVPTLFGTASSFKRAEVSGDTISITVFYRVDSSLNAIYEAIISALIYSQAGDRNWQDESWESKELLVDYICKYTVYSKFMENYVGTIDLLQQNQSEHELQQETEQFITTFGIPRSSTFSIVNNRIMIYEHPLKHKLTNSEKTLLIHLINNKHRVVSFDEIAGILWKDISKYSPWAISKHIERLRKVIKENGIYFNVIFTKRGRGYYLYD